MAPAKRPGAGLGRTQLRLGAESGSAGVAVQGLEIASPIRGYGSGILEIVGVQGFDEAQTQIVRFDGSHFTTRIP